MKFPRLVLLDRAQASNAAVARPLIGPRRDDNPLPWLALATGQENGQFILSGDKSQLEEAQANTQSLPYQWNVVGQKGFLWFKRPSLLRAYGDLTNSIRLGSGQGSDDMSTEVLLNPKAMRAAETLLQSTSLGVVIPKRGWLLAAPVKPGEIQATTPLFQAAQGIASRGGVYALCGNVVIFVQNGTLMGIEVRSDREKYVSLSLGSDADW